MYRNRDGQLIKSERGGDSQDVVQDEGKKESTLWTLETVLCANHNIDHIQGCELIKLPRCTGRNPGPDFEHKPITAITGDRIVRYPREDM